MLLVQALLLTGIVVQVGSEDLGLEGRLDVAPPGLGLVGSDLVEVFEIKTNLSCCNYVACKYALNLSSTRVLSLTDYWALEDGQLSAEVPRRSLSFSRSYVKSKELDYFRHKPLLSVVN